MTYCPMCVHTAHEPGACGAAGGIPCACQIATNPGAPRPEDVPIPLPLLPPDEPMRNPLFWKLIGVAAFVPGIIGLALMDWRSNRGDLDLPHAIKLAARDWKYAFFID